MNRPKGSSSGGKIFIRINLNGNEGKCIGGYKFSWRIQILLTV